MRLTQVVMKGNTIIEEKMIRRYSFELGHVWEKTIGGAKISIIQNTSRQAEHLFLIKKKLCDTFVRSDEKHETREYTGTLVSSPNKTGSSRICKIRDKKP